jgi:glycosyltransferase involved in cell wall biosynthesis
MPSNTSKKSGILVSFIIPTLNAGRVIEPCIKSILQQTIKNVEIIIADGGSTDSTILKIRNLSKIKNFKLKIVENPLKTAEAGKAVSLKHTKGKYVALIDSDNILPTRNWLKKMLLPLEKNLSLTCSEPIRFTYRRDGGFIERYSALLGANDPYAWFNDVYDRYSYLTNNWTGLKIDQIDFGQYLKISLKPNQTLPTIGANGTIFRSSFLKKYQFGDYLFDIDLITFALNKTGKPLEIAKVKTGIIHTYCESSISKFIRKQNRRLNDYFYFLSFRNYNWNQKIDFFSLIKSNFSFCLYSLTLIPAIIDSLRGFFIKPDFAWLFHPLACFITSVVYVNTYFFKHQINRSQWQQ